MDITYERISYEKAGVLKKLFEFYNYEFGPYLDKMELNEEGQYKYKDVNIYFNYPAYDPYFIRVNQKLAGFVIVKKIEEIQSTIFTIDQFFITRKYSGQGVGRMIAKQIFAQYSGLWRVSQVETNYSAQAFWRKVIKEYTNNSYTERYNDRRESIQEFFSGRAPFELHVNEKITLKLLEDHDAHSLFSLIDQSRNYLRQWLPWLDHSLCVEDTKTFIRENMRQFMNHNGFSVGIWYHKMLVGSIGLHQINWLDRSTSIGYWLAESFQNQGIMTGSCRGLINYAFYHLKLNRVEIRAASENKKSRAIPERLGFQNEGCIRQAGWLYDHFVDHYVYGMLAKNWE